MRRLNMTQLLESLPGGIETACIKTAGPVALEEGR